jgi:DNA-binding SARP family transcriptional activator
VLTFRVLGPLEVTSEKRTIYPKGSKQGTLLAALLANPRQLVSSELLIIELWGEDHPARVENDLQAHVSRLRRQLASLEPAARRSRVVTHISGYELIVDDEELDAARFVTGLDEIRSASPTDSVDSAGRLRKLLGCWRGQAFGHLERGPICQAAAVRYEEHRIAAYQLLFEHELRNRNYSRIIPELRGLLTQYEFHEKFWQQLMIALYHSGRQSDALSVYRDLGRRLSDEFGIDLSPTMREYERAVLAHDPFIGAR